MSKHVRLVTAAAFLAAAPVLAQAPGVPCPQFRVNTRIAGYQTGPDVAARPDGSFVVVWQTDGPRDADISGQRYDALGHALGTEFPVSALTAGDQFTPVVAVTAVRGGAGTRSAGADGGGAAPRRRERRTAAYMRQFKNLIYM